MYKGFVFTTKRQRRLTHLGPEARLRTLDMEFLRILLQQKHSIEIKKKKIKTCKAVDLDSTWTWTVEEVEREITRRERAEQELEQKDGDNGQNE